MKFGYTIVYVASVRQALAFYEAAFGFETRFLRESGDYGELDTGAARIWVWSGLHWRCGRKILVICGSMRAEVAAADALLIASPEYAHGIIGKSEKALDRV